MNGSVERVGGGNGMFDRIHYRPADEATHLVRRDLAAWRNGGAAE